MFVYVKDTISMASVFESKVREKYPWVLDYRWSVEKEKENEITLCGEEIAKIGESQLCGCAYITISYFPKTNTIKVLSLGSAELRFAAMPRILSKTIQE